MRILITLIVFLAITEAFSQPDVAARRRNYNHDNSVMMKDFDVVSYFKGKPLKGDSKYYYNYKGLKYLFSSAQNLEEFKKSPEKYEPAYGGWCAYGMSHGAKDKADPSTYKIIGGRLFVFSNYSGVNQLLKWNVNEKKLKPLADKQWTLKMEGK